VSATYLPVPDKPLTTSEVVERWPTLRQSLLADFDDCALYSYFGMKYTQGWSTHPQARGTIFHRFAADVLRTMQAQDADQIPVGVALAILEETLEQRGVPWRDRVRLPLREVPVLRMAATKFAKDNRFTIRNIIDVEKRLEATLTYAAEGTGEAIERTLSGMPDAIVLDKDRPDDSVIVLDWKATWALPPERDSGREGREDPDRAEEKAAERNLSYEGYFQQRFYAWLILKNYPSINAVTLREFYVYRSKPRAATITRAQLERVERELGTLAREFDLALGYGKPKKLRYPDIQGTPWEPSPGKHCYFCPLRHHCPIADEVLNTIAIQNPEQAKRAIAILEVAEATAKQVKEAARPYAEEHGPIPGRHSKGRRVWGPRTNSAGKPEFTFFVPKGSDRAPEKKPEDKALEDALRRAAEEQRDDGDDGRVAA
jgi:hypothetical protein